MVSCVGVGILLVAATGCGSNTPAEKVDAGKRKYCDARCLETGGGIDTGPRVDVSGSLDTSASTLDGAGADRPGQADLAPADRPAGPDSDGPSDSALAAGGLDGGKLDAADERVVVPTDAPTDATASSGDAVRGDASDSPSDPPTERADWAADRPSDPLAADAADVVAADVPADVRDDTRDVPLDTSSDVAGVDVAASVGACLLNAVPWRKDWPTAVTVTPGGLAAGPQGSLWTGGVFFADVDFGAAVLTFSETSTKNGDAFLAKLDPATGVASASFAFGDPNNGKQKISQVAVAKNGNVAVHGSVTGEIDFTEKNSGGEGDPGADYLVAASASLFYAVFDAASTGAHPTLIKPHLVDIGFGGTIGAGLNSIVSHPDQNAFFVCGFASKAVPKFDDQVATNKGLITGAAGTYGGGADIVVAKIDAVTGNVLWGKQFGGTGDQKCMGVAVDGNGDVFITGTNKGALDFGGSTTALPAGSPNGELFVAKLGGSDGVALVAKTWGTGNGDAYGYQTLTLATDGANNVYLGGSTKSTIDFGGGLTLPGDASKQSFRAFIAKLTGALVPSWGHIYGSDVQVPDTGGGSHSSPANQYVTAVATASTGDVLVAGYYAGGMSEVGLPQNPSVSSTYDGFIAQVSADGANVCAKAYGSPTQVGSRQMTSLAVARLVSGDQTDLVVPGGSFSSSIQIGSVELTTADPSTNHSFVCRLGASP